MNESLMIILKWEIVNSECSFYYIIRLGFEICLNALHMILL